MNRREVLLLAAARCFVERGYTATSMRDIAAAAGMKAGSIYYHFPSKEHLFLAVYEAGVREIGAVVQAAIEAHGDPWGRLEAACATHLTVLLAGGPLSQVIQRELPADSMAVRPRLVALRDEYEGIFTRLMGELHLPEGANRQDLRLMLMGALNYTHTWYRAGPETPADIARNFVRFLRRPMEVTA
ncbi:MAG: TetR/AcrR family transcriptional regulator [Candidatus Lambdaproteobacteria bacterium]|nr:TetR/AcrR family transcriptional regulator [Candidatus Lambdaproteobacteria bacterium]